MNILSKKPTINFPLFLVIIALVVMFSTGCKPEEVIEDPCALTNEHGEWGYDDHAGGPACWSSVNKGSNSCLGSSQSPIDITGWESNTTLPSLSYTPSLTETSIEYNGHTIKFNIDPGTFITYGQTTNGLFDDYTLSQFHFHTNSEHQVDGNHAPLETHFVHKSIWANQYIVVSVMFEEGAENTELAKFIPNLPISENVPYKSSDTYSAFDLLPDNKSYYHYKGSLTTPPCSEVVTWIVMENKVEASKAQIDKFSEIMGDNFREVQPLGTTRKISHVVL